ncbi:hypothetical protein AJ79_04947 [Helicocarpus griseus UAMH5409]|uniref:Peptidase A1 domain-containing protein n=1 Tax=Helicocarpus griseus UAMH5409 TaxID=1447875 RepID=A0A2B7XRE5_9EURO|nr:hypothetical protein AJ79_04947 [Helicocarpus griseus UAMH5409]
MLFASVISLSCLLLAQRSHTQECASPAPTIELPIANVTIGSAFSNSVRRGLGLGVGNPPQTVVAAINADWNNSFFWRSDQCKGNSEYDRCSWFHGGDLNAEDSKSWVPTKTSGKYDFRNADGLEFVTSPWGEDAFTLTPDTTVESVPVYSVVDGDPPQNSLGFGRASSFLDALVAQKKIATRTWSLFWGWEGMEDSQKMEGNFVLGGYDKAKTKGENFTTGFSDTKVCSSGLAINLKKIHITTWYGAETGIFDSSGSTLSVCIRPDLPSISLPQTIFDGFKGSLPGKYLGPTRELNNNAILVDAYDVFRGNLTFTLESGLAITVPNHQLVRPNIEISSHGQQTIANDSRVIPVRPLGPDNAPYLGQAFLSAVYLHVNNDRKQFSIWEAEATEQKDIVGISEDSCGGNDEPATKPATPKKTSTKPSGGAIAGIVIGVLAAIALVGLALFFLVRRRQPNDRSQRDDSHARALIHPEPHRMAELDDTGSPISSYANAKELPSPQEPAQRYELPVKEYR